MGRGKGKGEFEGRSEMCWAGPLRASQGGTTSFHRPQEGSSDRETFSLLRYEGLLRCIFSSCCCAVNRKATQELRQSQETPGPPQNLLLLYLVCIVYVDLRGRKPALQDARGELLVVRKYDFTNFRRVFHLSTGRKGVRGWRGERQANLHQG